MSQEKCPERPKFGAWYIPAKLWKKETVQDQMKDPKEMDDAQLSEKKKMSLALVRKFLEIFFSLFRITKLLKFIFYKNGPVGMEIVLFSKIMYFNSIVLTKISQ